MVNWWFGARWFGSLTGYPYKSQSLSFSGIPGVQATKPSHQLTISWSDSWLGRFSHIPSPPFDVQLMSCTFLSADWSFGPCGRTCDVPKAQVTGLVEDFLVFVGALFSFYKVQWTSTCSIEPGGDLPEDQNTVNSLTKTMSHERKYPNLGSKRQKKQCKSWWFYFIQMSNEKKWVCLGHIGNEILPSYMGITITYYKDPY